MFQNDFQTFCWFQPYIEPSRNSCVWLACVLALEYSEGVVRSLTEVTFSEQLCRALFGKPSLPFPTHPLLFSVPFQARGTMKLSLATLVLLSCSLKIFSDEEHVVDLSRKPVNLLSQNPKDCY